MSGDASVDADGLPLFPPLAGGLPVPTGARSLARLVVGLQTAVLTVHADPVHGMVVFLDREPVDGMAIRGDARVLGPDALDEIEDAPLDRFTVTQVPRELARVLGCYFLPTALAGLPAHHVSGEEFVHSLARPGQRGCVVVRAGDALGLVFLASGRIALAYRAGGSSVGGFEQVASLFDDPAARLWVRLGPERPGDVLPDAPMASATASALWPEPSWPEAQQQPQQPHEPAPHWQPTPQAPPAYATTPPAWSPAPPDPDPPETSDATSETRPVPDWQRTEEDDQAQPLWQAPGVAAHQPAWPPPAEPQPLPPAPADWPPAAETGTGWQQPAAVPNGTDPWAPPAEPADPARSHRTPPPAEQPAVRHAASAPLPTYGPALVDLVQDEVRDVLGPYAARVEGVFLDADPSVPGLRAAAESLRVRRVRLLSPQTTGLVADRVIALLDHVEGRR